MYMYLNFWKKKFNIIKKRLNLIKKNWIFEYLIIESIIFWKYKNVKLFFW